MKVRFFLKVPPSGGEAVEYVEVDPDDSGLNKVVHAATDADRSRWASDYEAWQKSDDSKQVPNANEPLDAGVPVTVKAALPVGREDEALASYRADVGDQVAAATSDQAQTPAAPRLVAAPTASESPAPGGPPAGGYDTTLLDQPASQVIEEVKGIQDGEELKALKAAERSGKSRITVLDAIDAQVATLKQP